MTLLRSVTDAYEISIYIALINLDMFFFSISPFLNYLKIISKQKRKFQFYYHAYSDWPPARLFDRYVKLESHPALIFFKAVFHCFY